MFTKLKKTKSTTNIIPNIEPILNKQTERVENLQEGKRARRMDRTSPMLKSSSFFPDNTGIQLPAEFGEILVDSIYHAILDTNVNIALAVLLNNLLDVHTLLRLRRPKGLAVVLTFKKKNKSIDSTSWRQYEII